jgi:hypothetical protein
MLSPKFLAATELAVVLQATPASWAPQWEILKGVMLTICAAGIISQWRKADANDKRLTILFHKIMGVEGKGGLGQDLEEITKIVEEIRWWKQSQEIMDIAERESHPGEDRRHRLRRDRDKINEAHIKPHD